MNPWTIVAVVASFGKAYATYQNGLAQRLIMIVKIRCSSTKIQIKRG